MIRLEPISHDHAESLQTLLEDPAIAATTPFPSPYPPDGARAYIIESLALRSAGTKYVFAVSDDSGRAVGMSLLKDVDAAAGEGELGYWIGRPFWGRGLATEAAEATLRFGFETLELCAVRAVCLEENPASLRVLAKLGFLETGRFAQSLPKWPEPRMSVSFRLDRSAWRSQTDRT
jgi:RimJ/RimL family protein N-acetyltransferase